MVGRRRCLLTAWLDSEAAGQIGPQDGYRVKADLPIQVIHVGQEAAVHTDELAQRPPALTKDSTR